MYIYFFNTCIHYIHTYIYIYIFIYILYIYIIYIYVSCTLTHDVRFTIYPDNRMSLSLSEIKSI